MSSFSSKSLMKNFVKNTHLSSLLSRFSPVTTIDNDKQRQVFLFLGGGVTPILTQNLTLRHKNPNASRFPSVFYAHNKETC
ncbi:hypothetical protein VNO77_27903 [Canavalia gladiata]|uniref:Uncharacterized protein n=1 Tax=Canavalia gladiata TaxID=3824 RepID=A0AAN9KYP9_CANGL